MRIVFWAGFWTFLLDQATKYLVVHWMGLAEKGMIDVFPPYLQLRMAWNTGVNFGLFAQETSIARWFLIGLALVISVGVLIWVSKERPRRAGLIAAGLLVGGALGNVVDRVLYGAVADFLNMSCCGFVNPYAFNVADIAIFAGAAALILLPAEKAT
ncbi:signal peptidase II [Pseudooceanicola atlanticus]|uniref:Lipoprotein signal peptidase n=1 Tax=Pseudooceanicola atlanticus TaxID=1461694 RepID=A0A0A0ELR8_9RHOB|nr:signal peptidase II [Pseudooceanicola atlanticus]KGM50127.1 lipoprotein signal peptidase [Pseudooceanicola atlanticus]